MTPIVARKDARSVALDIPQIGIYRTDDHRYYWMGEGPYPGVTTSMKALDKSDVLVGWAKRETAAFAIRNIDILAAHRGHNAPMPECPPCRQSRPPFDRARAAQYWVSSIPDYQRDVAADAGTRIHAIAERMATEPDYRGDPALTPYATQYARFQAHNRPQYLAIEYMGMNLTAGYGGTGDFIALMTEGPFAGLTVAVDIKSHTKPTPVPAKYYPETGMQLAACTRFEFIGKPNDPTQYPLPKVNAYAVLLLGADDYSLIPYRVTDDTYEAFLHCLALTRWRNGEGKTMGRVA